MAKTARFADDPYSDATAYPERVRVTIEVAE